MSVQALTQVDPNQFFNLSSSNNTGPQRLDTKVGGVAVSTDFSGRLSVTTAEGDKITLSADIESDFRAVNYTSHAAGNGTTTDIETKYAESSLKQEFGVTVEGDLNDQEVKDLSTLFRKVANIFKKVLNGQDDAALAKTAKLADSFGNYSSLSGLDLKVDFERSVTRFAAALTGEATGQPSTPAPDPAPTSTTPAPIPSAPTPQAVIFGPIPTTDTAIPVPSSDTIASDATSPTATTEAVTQDAAPTPAAVTPAPSAGITMPAQVTAPAAVPSQTSSIVQQVLDATQNARIETEKLGKYFSQFLKNFGKVLQNEKADGKQQTDGTQTTPTPTTPPVPAAPAQTGPSVSLAYQSTTRQTSFSFSIRS
ncbi:MAG: hypothetical protein ABIR36_11465 [Nitrospiraceae bacterium]